MPFIFPVIYPSSIYSYIISLHLFILFILYPFLFLSFILHISFLSQSYLSFILVFILHLFFNSYSHLLSFFTFYSFLILKFSHLFIFSVIVNLFFSIRNFSHKDFKGLIIILTVFIRQMI